ncbi:MAG: hypothetical protein FWE40_01390 [Oscillospiraceae bacterium]|nr:hypothetical protein [Oscillospiraceae bacterium]
MKRNKTLRIAIVLLALVMVSTIGMATTLARFVDEAIVGTAAVVRAGIWNVDADGATFTVGATTPTVLAPSTQMAHSSIQARNADDIIVPGSIVSFTPDTVEIVNNSEVAAEIRVTAISVAVTGFVGVDNLQFRLGTAGTWGTLAALETAIENFIDGTTNTSVINAVTTADLPAAALPVIYVGWIFHTSAGQDDADTDVGAAQWDAYEANELDEDNFVTINFTLQARQAAAP